MKKLQLLIQTEKYIGDSSQVLCQIFLQIQTSAAKHKIHRVTLTFDLAYR